MACIVFSTHGPRPLFMKSCGLCVQIAPIWLWRVIYSLNNIISGRQWWDDMIHQSSWLFHSVMCLAGRRMSLDRLRTKGGKNIKCPQSKRYCSARRTHWLTTPHDDSRKQYLLSKECAYYSIHVLLLRSIRIAFCLSRWACYQDSEFPFALFNYLMLIFY